MADFTSTTLFGLVVAAVERIDPALAAGIARPDPMHAGITPGRDKTALLASLANRHGTAAVLRIGQYLDLAEESPVLDVLTRSNDPGVLAEKWMRLERYYHAAHRTRIDTGNPREWICQRQSAGRAPSPAENALIAGVLFGLVEMIGASGSQLIVGGRTLGAQDLPGAEVSGDFARFTIRWKDDEADRDGPAPNRSRAINDRLTDLLVSDIGRSWKIADAAGELAFSERSLQRHLAGTQRNFSSVLRRARMREATRLLRATDWSLAEIGYCCGYADQAHFQRDFRRVANMTPRTFRQVAREDGVKIQ